jgi:hypothetical protein
MNANNTTTTNTTMDDLVRNIDILTRAVNGLAVNFQSLVDIITNNPAGIPAGTSAATPAGTPASTPVNNAADDSASVGEFEHRHYKVFHVQLKAFAEHHFHRQIYVEKNTLAGFPGHKFHVKRARENDSQEMAWIFFDENCLNPVRSKSRSKMRHIGWVLRERFDRIQTTCNNIPLPGPDQCCHDWTDAAIAELRRSGVLSALRASDRAGVILGPSAVDDGSF